MSQLRPLLYKPPGAAILDPLERKAAVRDRYGTTYFFNHQCTAIKYLADDGRASVDFWTPDAGLCLTDRATAQDDAAGVAGEAPAFNPVEEVEPPQIGELRGMAITSEDYLVVGTLDPGGLLIFDLHGGGPPMWVPGEVFEASDSPPDAAVFQPFDMATRPGGGFWVLDRPVGEGARLWAIDRYLRIESFGAIPVEVPVPQPDFLPKDADGPPPASTTIVPVAPIMLTGLEPVAITALCDDSVLVLSNDPIEERTTLVRYIQGERVGGEIDLTELILDQVDVDALTTETGWTGYDMAAVSALSTLIPDEVTGTLFFVGADGKQTFSFTLRADAEEWQLTISEAYYPMQAYSGRSLVESVDGKVYYDYQETWLPLVELPRHRYERNGSVQTMVLDGNEPGCVWHRLVVDACIPAGTEVIIETRAANQEGLLELASWYREPALYKKGSGAEIPFFQAFDAREREGANTGSWELLFQEAQGRYLQIRLSMRGTGRSTPRLINLRTHYPRFSYLGRLLAPAYIGKIRHRLLFWIAFWLTSRGCLRKWKAA